MISLTSYIQEWKQSIWDINFFQEFKIWHGIWRNKSWDNRWEQRRHSKGVLHVYVMRFLNFFFFFTQSFSLTPSSCQLLVPRVGHKCFFTLKEDNFHLNLVFVWVQHFLSITFAFLASISTSFCSFWNHRLTTTPPQDLVWCKGEQLCFERTFQRTSLHPTSWNVDGTLTTPRIAHQHWKSLFTR